MLLRQAGSWRYLAQTLGSLGFTVLSNGDLESAQEFLDEAYEAAYNAGRGLTLDEAVAFASDGKKQA